MTLSLLDKSGNVTIENLIRIEAELDNEDHPNKRDL